MCIAQSIGIRELKIGGNGEFTAPTSPIQFEIELFLDRNGFGTVLEILPGEQAARLQETAV